MLHGLNELVIRDRRYLLVGVSSSHLARLAQVNEHGRGALAEWLIRANPKQLAVSARWRERLAHRLAPLRRPGLTHPACRRCGGGASSRLLR